MKLTQDYLCRVALGAVLTVARERAGFTQAEMAKKRGVNQSTIARLEAGKLHPEGKVEATPDLEVIVDTVMRTVTNSVAQIMKQCSMTVVTLDSSMTTLAKISHQALQGVARFSAELVLNNTHQQAVIEAYTA